MRLRNPGGGAQAVLTTKQVKGQLSSVYNTDNRADAFLSWCDTWGTGQLGNHFAPADGLFAELAESYHRVLFAPALSQRQLNGLINRECRAWDARLDRLLGEVQDRMVFLGRPGHLVVLDTSALMEGTFFTEFDWHTLDASLQGGPIRLILPSLVVEELDELKRHRDARQKAQARKVLTNLWELHRANPTEPAALPALPDVTVEVLLDGDWHERRPNNDGEIIDQAVAVQELTGNSVILAAGDYTQLYRAAPAGLTAVLMPRPGDTVAPVPDQARPLLGSR